MSASLPSNEEKRLEALHRYRILDTAPEQAFDDFVLLASTICQTPMATMTLVDRDRQWFKAALGMCKLESAREHAFCAHTILGDEVMVVEDARDDARFAENPSVTDDPGIRFYAGAPLIDGEGMALGAICALGPQPRPLTAEQGRALQALARRVIAQLELRRASADLAEAVSNIKTLEGLLPICSHCKGIRDDKGYWQSVESYVESHSEVDFTHGICPACLQEVYPEVYAQLRAKGQL